MDGGWSAERWKAIRWDGKSTDGLKCHVRWPRCLPTWPWLPHRYPVFEGETVLLFTAVRAVSYQLSHILLSGSGGGDDCPHSEQGNLWKTISNPFKATQLQVVELLQTPAIWLLNDGSWVHQHLSESLTSWRYSTDELMEWVCEKPKGSNHLFGHIKQAVLGRSVVSHSLRPHGL